MAKTNPIQKVNGYLYKGTVYQTEKEAIIQYTKDSLLDLIDTIDSLGRYDCTRIEIYNHLIDNKDQYITYLQNI